MGVARQSPPSPELKVFSGRLQKAIEFKKIDIAVLVKDSEYKSDDIHRLLRGMREPGMKKLILLANSLGCSVDYLLGLAPEAQRASVVVEADTDAIKLQSSEHGQTSRQISGKAGRFIAMIPKLLESDVDLLMYLAGFLIERKEKGLSRFVKAVTAEPKKETERVKPIENFVRGNKNKDGLDGCSPDADDDDFDADELWDDVDDDFDEDEFDDDEDFDADDDFDYDFDD
jgi:transcriptional regulator with XRE-family HTH domain